MGKIGFLIQHEKVVDSTQKLAMKLANEGAEEGVVVSANIQTAGRGQKNRTWYTGDGENIAVSIILRPNLKPNECQQLTLISAVAVVQAIKEVTTIEASIKWPNDILINGKKLVGILTEMKIIDQQLQHIILGIGMNVNTSANDFSNEISQIATSLMIETNSEIDKLKFMQVLFERLEIIYRQFLNEGFKTIKPLWENAAMIVGKEVIATNNNKVIHGTAIGISDEGILLIKDEFEIIHEIYSADIVLNPSQN